MQALTHQLSPAREFVLNMMSEWFLESANHTCGSYDRGVDELLLANLTPVPSVKVRCSQHRASGELGC